jgi:hypothetical protein
MRFSMGGLDGESDNEQAKKGSHASIVRREAAADFPEGQPMPLPLAGLPSKIVN